MGNKIIYIILVTFLCAQILWGDDNINSENLYPQFIVNETEDSVTYIDTFGTKTTVSKEPKRVVIAFNSILGLWYFSGGKSLTKVKGSVNVPDEAKGLIDLGSTNSLSMEAIIALDPDLVILAANYGAQVAMGPILKEIGIEVMNIDTSIHSYNRFKENAYLFSKINRTEDKYRDKVAPIISSVNKIINRTNNIRNRPKVAAIFATSRNLKLESDLALTGEMIKILGGRNILEESDIITSGETRIPFSIEALIVQNPDIIMFSTMGSLAAAKKNIGKMIRENPVWSEVNAVKNNRVYYLPKQYSVYKPNQLYDKAFLYIAKLMYPGELGDL